MPNRCASNPQMGAPDAARDWNGWGGNPSNDRFKTRSGLKAADVPRLKLKWAFGYPGGLSAFGQPTVVAGRVFVGTDTGYVYSLDAKTGCVFWSYPAKAGVRNAMTVAMVAGRPAVFFGDVKANVYGLDAQTGRQLWTNHVEEHFTDRVTAAPAYAAGVLYVPISSWEEFRAADATYECCTSVGAVCPSRDAHARTRRGSRPRPAQEGGGEGAVIVGAKNGVKKFLGSTPTLPSPLFPRRRAARSPPHTRTHTLSCPGPAPPPSPRPRASTRPARPPTRRARPRTGRRGRARPRLGLKRPR
jgi:polyvinyl alcohol dehydrogenase (cytochrome)